jgi:site-specific DNA-methyltransferase (adenine-specific)
MNLDNLVGERHHAPDILDCLANLSSDEVYTPPHVAKGVLDLLPAEVWTNPKHTFLDPVCKTGVFLRECAARLMVGLKDVIPNEDQRREHIFQKMLYGISITELTGHISRRSVYYSKDASSDHSVVRFDNEQGNIKYIRSNHTFRNRKCIVCGGQDSLERGITLENYAYSFIHEEDIYNMKFDVIIGNPPYQLEDGGHGASSTPIFQLFVQKAKSLKPRFLSFVIPARWYSEGKGLDEFREQMINDRSLKCLVDYPKLFECFPGVEIKGGVCFFLRDDQWDGDCEVRNIMDGEVLSVAVRDLRSGGDVLIRDNNAVSILEKVKSLNEESIANLVSSRKPFGLATNFTDYSEVYFDQSIKLFRRGGVSYVLPEKISSNVNWINKWKVLTPKAGDGHGRVPMKVLGEPIVTGPGTACTETYLVAGVFDTESQARNYADYLCSKFARFLVSLRKHTQDVTNKRFSFVPKVDFNKRHNSNDLYAKYGLTDFEISYIESMILDMSL